MAARHTLFVVVLLLMVVGIGCGRSPEAKRVNALRGECIGTVKIQVWDREVTTFLPDISLTQPRPGAVSFQTPEDRYSDRGARGTRRAELRWEPDPGRYVFDFESTWDLKRSIKGMVLRYTEGSGLTGSGVVDIDEAKDIPVEVAIRINEASGDSSWTIRMPLPSVNERPYYMESYEFHFHRKKGRS